MAEAIVNSRLADTWQAFSAGTHPSGYVHPKALVVLSEIGIHHAGRSKNVTEFLHDKFDLILTVCDSAKEECPVWLGNGLRLHHSFPDPAMTNDLADFRKVRDEIEKILFPILLGWQASSSFG